MKVIVAEQVFSSETSNTTMCALVLWWSFVYGWALGWSLGWSFIVLDLNWLTDKGVSPVHFQCVCVDVGGSGSICYASAVVFRTFRMSLVMVLCFLLLNFQGNLVLLTTPFLRQQGFN